MKIILPLFCLLHCCILAQAQYTAHSIPDSLKENAYAVIRNQETTLTIKSDKEYELVTKMIVTVLDAKAKWFDAIVLHYDEGDNVKIKYAHIYDEHGKKRKSMKQSDIIERSAFTNNVEAMDFSDNKIKAYFFNTEHYPHTVEYETVERINGTMNLPDWTPVGSYHTSCEQATYTVVHPTDYELRLSYSEDLQPTKTYDNGKKSFQWRSLSIKAKKDAPYSPAFQTIFPWVRIAPNSFILEGRPGTMNTWADFSQFNFQLIKGRDKLSEDEVNKIKNISAQHQTTPQKINALYQYMQNKTRYVSVQLGIGGWQPFEASFVSEKGYGDCKALSNYMHAILKAANIPSFYALVKAANEPNVLSDDFPINDFNHVILCVPHHTDTLWLECTSQQNPTGYLGSFAANRKALLVAPTGGKLVATQKLLASDNLKKRVVQATIDSMGNYELDIKTDYAGTRQEEIFYKIKAWSNDKLKNEVARHLPLSNFEIQSLQHKIIENRIPTVQQHLELSTNNPFGRVKKRIFFSPSFNFHQNDWATAIATPGRTTPFSFHFGKTDIDTAIIQIPSTYRLEGLPKPIAVRNDFGTFQTQIITDPTQPNRLLYVRRFQLFANHFPASAYANFQSFVKTIQRSDSQKIVLVRQ